MMMYFEFNEERLKQNNSQIIHGMVLPMKFA